MARPGFIHGKLDIKLLILYLMARVAAPIDFATLTDLSLCDDGVDYFLFAEAVPELVDSAHLSREGELYSITEKGRNALDDERRLISESVAKFTETLTEDERSRLADALDTITEITARLQQ